VFFKYIFVNNNNYEIDKIIIAVALSVIVFVFSMNVGSFLYTTENFVDKSGYAIEITDALGGAAEAPQGIPDKIDIAAIMKTANAEAGKNIFNKCAICHTIGKGEANKVGPNLWGVVTAKIGRHSTDFKYSDAMLKHGQDVGSWGYEELYRYLYSPKTHVPGTKMAFAGLRKDDERANLIAYLRTQSDNPSPLP
jgi:cytochrome c